jgi:uncharacterized coiled-coil protein SlyX
MPQLTRRLEDAERRIAEQEDLIASLYEKTTIAGQMYLMTPSP